MNDYIDYIAGGNAVLDIYFTTGILLSGYSRRKPDFEEYMDFHNPNKYTKTVTS